MSARKKPTCCPYCDDGWYVPLKRGYACKVCKSHFDEPKVRPQKVEKKIEEHRGPFQIAERITIPQYRWGGSRLG